MVLLQDRETRKVSVKANSSELGAAQPDKPTEPITVIHAESRNSQVNSCRGLACLSVCVARWCANVGNPHLQGQYLFGTRRSEASNGTSDKISSTSARTAERREGDCGGKTKGSLMLLPPPLVQSEAGSGARMARKKK